MKKILIFLAIIISIYSYAQKRPMTVDDTKIWNRIVNRQISTDGNFVAYRIKPNKGDANLFLYNDLNQKTIQFERGKNAKLGYDNNLLIFKIAVQADSLRQKKLDKVKKDQLPTDSLGIYLFDSDSLIKIEKIKSYYLPEENSEWLAYKYDYKAPKDTTLQDSLNTDTLKTETDSLKTEKKEYKQEGQRLVIFNTKNLEKFIFDNIDMARVSKNARTFAFTQTIKDSLDTVKVFVFDTKTKQKKLVFEEIGELTDITIDDEGMQLAYAFSNDTTDIKNYSLWYFDIEKQKNSMLLDTLSKQKNDNLVLSIDRDIYFSESGKRLYLGLSEEQNPEPKDTLLENEKVKLDIWSWTDKRLQPEQLKNLKSDLEKSYLSFFELKSKTLIRLEDSLVSTRSRRDADQIYLLGESDDKYARATSWKGGDIASDYYIIDTKTGKRRTLAENKIWYTSLSPTGKYTLAWDKINEYWISIDNKSFKQVILTKDIDDVFYNSSHDTPSLRGANGRIGWSEDEKYIYINSQYNIWKFSTDAKTKAINLTQVSGKNEYRYQRLDRDAKYLPSDEWMLHVFNHETMAESYQILNLKTLKKTVLIEEDKAFYPPLKAKNAEKIIWANSTFVDYPELKISNLDYTNIKTLTRANPQQDSIYWGKMTLTKWQDFNGDTLKGLLVLPENFDANKKYPVIIYFYEKYSESLYVYRTPRPSHSTINFPFYTSNGYIVFVPDINYGTGLPGKDAYNAVISGTQHISNLPFVNTNKIGIQGQSWGGYQVAYLVTQTNLYACAMAGAPVSNMTSAYGGIRWASGMSRMFQYEHTQSRIGGSLWERRDKYIENSPVFFADRVQTPLLIMHNDGDGAVPWYQGIEYFVALRRLDKPAWLLNYNGDSHNLMKWPNRVDLTKRMFGFFEYYLKDKPAPEWLEKGLPATKKGKELRY